MEFLGFTPFALIFKFSEISAQILELVGLDNGGSRNIFYTFIS
jgi:hypothetical protein